MKKINAHPGVEIELGKRGENLARCVVFDISSWVTTYGEGTAHLLHQRNGDKTPYPCVIKVKGDKVRWPLTEVDMAVAGRGKAELQYFVGDTRVKSEIWATRTKQTLNNAGPAPEEPAENWLNTMLELGTETKENAQAVEEAAQEVAAIAESVKASEESVQNIADDALSARDEAIQVAKDVEAYVSSAESAEQGAKEAQAAAEQAAAFTVADAENRLQGYVDDAENAANEAAAGVEQKLQGYVADAETAMNEAQSAAEEAAAGVENRLSGYVDDAEEAKTGAEAAQAAAEKARDEAAEIAGGDFATKAEAQGYADTAESNAKSYTDQKIAAIPTPDVSGQIDAHNDSTTAHADIRSLASNAASAAGAAQSTADTHIANKSNPHGVTAEQVGAAPTGYGLGVGVVATPLLDDCHKVAATGWYRIVNGTTANYPPAAGNGMLRAECYNENWCMLTAFINVASGTEVYCLKKTSGTWGQWEPYASAVGAATIAAVQTAQTAATNAQNAANSKATMDQVNAAISTAIGTAIGGSY